MSGDFTPIEEANKFQRTQAACCNCSYGVGKVADAPVVYRRTVMAAIRERMLLPESGTDFPASARRSGIVDSPICESGAVINIDFEDAAADRGDLILTSVQKQTFRSDLPREQAVVQIWFGQQQWPPDLLPDLRVDVSPRFRISKSLVPAWSGQRGQMEFPASRVATRKAAIAHELTHVYFPNANRFMAEGLALYIQAEIGSNSAFPNFGKPLHALVCEILADVVPEFHLDRQSDVESLASLQLADLDTIATPSPLALTIGPNVYGEEPRGQRVVYAIAGSFAAHLIETHGIAKFRDLYMRTPLRPHVCDAGAPDRWIDVYGVTLAELELEWKSMVANCEHVTVSR